MEEISNLRNQQVELLHLSKEMEERLNDLEKQKMDMSNQLQCQMDIVIYIKFQIILNNY